MGRSDWSDDGVLPQSTSPWAGVAYGFADEREDRTFPQCHVGRRTEHVGDAASRLRRSSAALSLLYLLHGYDADITDWARGTNLSDYATRHQLIIVTPDASHSWYVNSVSNPNAHYDDYIMKEVIAYVDKNFRTIPEPFARAIAGVSMGGFGAMFLGLEHRDQFAAIGSFSGSVGFGHITAPPPLPAKATEEEKRMRQEYVALMGEPGSKEQKARDVFELAQQVPVEEVPMLFLVCGGQDGGVEQTHAFLQVLGKRRIPYEYREISPRGHEWRIWNEEIPVFLDKLEKLDGFEPLREQGAERRNR